PELQEHMAAQDPTNRAPPAGKREDRLKAALKANMAKRKAQSKARTKAQQNEEYGQDQNETGKD
ncbi:MAG: hypothetical protein AAFQ60_03735, partial [Pseudomonadota bacterium]